ncbi:hypothetical protein F5Y08DRAFT_351426 [Xylaria arbuscula]|nr:hypothetical protein F5Y08DRAFT_351426 [Xylaria arbuscula]
MSGQVLDQSADPAILDPSTDEGETSAIRLASDYDYGALRTSVNNDVQIPEEDTLYAMQYSYEKFRDSVFKDLNIPTGAKLGSTDHLTVDVEDETTFIIALTQIQGSEEIKLARTKDTNKPTWVLAPDPEGNKSLKKPEQPAKKPEQQKPPSKPKPPPPGSVSSDHESDRRSDKTGGHRRNRRRTRNAVIRRLNHGFEKIKDDEWTQVCRFFSCKEDVADIRLEGIALPILDYQAYAIWRVFMQAVDQRRTMVIGDDVGLGKTAIALCIATILHMMLEVERVVRHERLYGRDSDNDSDWGPPRQHLERSNQRAGAVCPTQGQGRVQCSCVNNSLSYRIVSQVFDLPTIVIAPPRLIPHWVREAQKWISNEYMRIRTAYQGITNKRLDMDNASVEQIKTVESQDNGSRRRKNRPGTRASRYIILVSSSGVDGFLRKFKKSDNEYSLDPAFMFFDEFQLYAGSHAHVTQPFNALDSLSSNRGRPIAIGLSASARSHIALFRPFVRYEFKCSPNTEIAGLRQTSDMDQYESAWRSLVGRIDLGGLSQRDETRLNNLLEFLRRFYPLMMISRMRGDEFRGKEILPVRPIDVRNFRLPIGPNHTRQVINSAVVRVRAYLERKYLKELSDWREKQEGPEPTRRVIAQRYLEMVADGEIPRGNLRELHYLSRSLTFPTVATLVADGHVDYSETRTGKINPMAESLTPHLLPGRPTSKSYEAIYKILKKSPWFKYRDLLIAESPKYKEIEDELTELLNISGLDASGDEMVEKDVGPPPDDDTNIRHGIIFADNPLSAFLIFMLLYTRSAQINLVVMYMHTQLSALQREEICEYMNEDCRLGDPVKILVSTINAAGTGYDFSRANTMILTEVPRSSVRQTQAFGCIDRIGQAMYARKIQLRYTDNFAETIRVVRNENRDKIGGVGNITVQKSTPLADLLGNLNGDVPEDVDGDYPMSGTSDNPIALSDSDSDAMDIDIYD